MKAERPGAPDATIATGARPPGSLQRMVRRRSMCIECPFRPPIENAIDMAGLLDVEFTCHMEDSPHVMGDSRVQCRGHWEAVRKYKRKSPNDKLTHEAGD